ncbi:MAG: hypothetical protein K8L99_18985 [Anaerolineae bacterium]|nr:hypothetical protein [Anaerolineae bacterium]
MLRSIIILLIAGHGIGHILFLVPLLGIADWDQSTRSWLLTEETPARLVGSILWGVAIIAFGAAVVGLLGQQGWWRGATIIAAVVSTVGLIIFWATPVTSPVIAALVFNLLVIGALLVAHWPSLDAVGA